MTWKIIRQALRHRRTLFIAYGVIGLLFLLLYLPTYPTVRDQAQTINQVYKSLPKGVLDAFNITNTSNSLMGFLASKHFGLVWLLMIILLMVSFAGGAIAREIDKRTMGLMLSLPVSRLRIYFGRLAAGILGLIGFIVVSELVIWPLAAIFHFPCPFGDVFNVAVLGALFGLAALGLGFMFSAMFSDTGKVYAGVGGLLLLMYVLNIIASLDAQLGKLKYVSLFHYYDPGAVIDGGRLGLAPRLVFLSVALVATIIGAVIFNRRDVSV